MSRASPLSLNTKEDAVSECCAIPFLSVNQLHQVEEYCAKIHYSSEGVAAPTLSSSDVASTPITTPKYGSLESHHQRRPLRTLFSRGGPTNHSKHHSKVGAGPLLILREDLRLYRQHSLGAAVKSDN